MPPTPPRAGTSRLLAMKFMNRLQPSDSTPTTSSPLASAPSTPTFTKTERAPSSEDEDGDEDGDRPSAKRRKVSSAGEPGTESPTTGGGSVAGGSTVAEMEATMRAAMDEEERRRQVAIKRRAAELGDEHWTWNAPLPPHVAAKLAANSAAATSRLPYSVVHVGFAEIDERGGAATNSSTTPSTPTSPALATSTKPNIMRFNMKKAVGKDVESGDDDDDSTQDGKKNGSRKRSRSDVGLKKKEPKLKNLTSLSGQGQSPSSTMKCHSCGKPGHKAAQCPQRKPSHKRR
ncbi:hypothetical protein SCUCBS95973_009335 [Sporothrix curviconia]|uniref:CCHC-type domain-containing protein n=1 Tax=Sporothrix curviconia TaxID=1260050 RepID=A0ABP0CU50_9PEZI